MRGGAERYNTLSGVRQGTVCNRPFSFVACYCYSIVALFLADVDAYSTSFLVDAFRFPRPLFRVALSFFAMVLPIAPVDVAAARVTARGVYSSFSPQLANSSPACSTPSLLLCLFGASCIPDPYFNIVLLRLLPRIRCTYARSFVGVCVCDTRWLFFIWWVPLPLFF